MVIARGKVSTVRLVPVNRPPAIKARVPGSMDGRAVLAAPVEIQHAVAVVNLPLIHRDPLIGC